jgi:tetratricopeptide (TPR) repeat protein
MPGREDEECFPPALRYKYDRRGHQTAKRADPLAADFREVGEGRRLAFLKLVAGMLGVGLDELVRRDQTRRQRQLAYLAAASLAGMAITSTLAVTAIQSRDAARDQRRQAEGLIGFMLGDLKDKLEPIGKLDALDGVGKRVLAYYHNQPIDDLSDSSLSQRSRALTLMAQVAEARGDVEGALRLYREAMAGTAESIRRDPNDPQAVFDHAQNVFYIGQIAHNRGDFRTAEASMREYRRLALRMIALSPDSMKYRMEEQYAETNLGVVLSDQRRFEEAAAQFADGQRTMEAIATADPNNREYQKSVAESLAWLADAKMAMGDLPGATAARKRDVAILERLFAQTGDVDYQQRLLPARRMLGVAYAAQGQTAQAAQQFRAAVAEADVLVPKEPNNTNWLEYAYKARLELANQLILAGDSQRAAQLVGQACHTVDELLRRDAKKPGWRSGLSRCRMVEARLALAAGDKQKALLLAEDSVTASRTMHSGSPVDDSYLIASAYRLVGDVQRQLGNSGGAHSAWQAAVAMLPTGAMEEPSEMAERAMILERLGRVGEAQQLARRLSQMGYHNPEMSSH